MKQDEDRLVEVQLRTPYQDAWASLMESLSHTVAPDLKFGGGSGWLRERLRRLAETAPRHDETFKLLRGAQDEP